MVFLCYHTPTAAKPAEAKPLEIFLQMDLIGTFTILCSLICYILALQWGGVTKAWASADVIGTLVGWLLLLGAFVVVEWWQGERAMIVPRLLKRRAIWTGSVFIFLFIPPSTSTPSFLFSRLSGSCSLNSANFLLIYYLPIYFQAIGNTSAIGSGIRNLPLILGTCKSTLSLFND